MLPDEAKNLQKYMFWQMAVFKKILKDKRGGIGVAVLAGVLCAAACLHAAAYWARQEAEEVQQRLLRRQLQFAVQALAKSDFKNSPLPKDGINLAAHKLYPGGYDLTAKITAETKGGITKYIINAAAGGQNFALAQLKITLPQEIIRLGRSYTLAAGKKLNGAENLPEGMAYAQVLGDILDSLDIESFAPFKELDFPAKTSLEELGLSGALYYDDGNYSKNIAASSKHIKGQGCLVAKMSVFIADGTKMPDFCVIISDGQIEIGKNAVLGKALLLSKYDITIKSGASVNGIVLCDGNLTLEDGAVFRRDETVLQPFITALRLNRQ